jgi:hypothetical protein
VRAAQQRLLAVRPLHVLSALVALQWTLVAALAATVRHNGWIYSMGVRSATLVPSSAAFEPEADVTGRKVRLRWRAVQSRAGAASYTIYRTAGSADLYCGPVRGAPDVCSNAGDAYVFSRPLAVKVP